MKSMKLFALSAITTICFGLVGCNNQSNNKDVIVLEVYNCAEYISETDEAEGVVGVLEQFEQYCKDTLLEFNKPDKTIAFITHTSASEQMVEIARRELELAGFENIVETTAGGTITSHCGENVLGILYINDCPENVNEDK